MSGNVRFRGAGFRGWARRCGGAGLLAGLLTGLMAALPVPAIADGLDAFLGRWDSSSIDCSHPQGDGVFVVEPRLLRFYESICEVGAVRPTGVGNAVTGRMSCEGEGETWTSDLIMARSQDDQLFVFYGDGYGFIAGRCR